MTTFRLPVKFRDSGERNFVILENADIRNARRIYYRILSLTDTFEKCGSIQRWKWRDKTETKGRWIDA